MSNNYITAYSSNLLLIHNKQATSAISQSYVDFKSIAIVDNHTEIIHDMPGAFLRIRLILLSIRTKVLRLTSLKYN